MNVIETYAQQFSELWMDENLFLPDGPEMCPAEGTRTLLEYARGSKDTFKHFKSIVVKQIICKTALVNGKEELHGVIDANIYFKVKQGEAIVPIIQVLHTKNNLITYLNSFWDLEKFKTMTDYHPELKEIFQL